MAVLAMKHAAGLFGPLLRRSNRPTDAAGGIARGRIGPEPLRSPTVDDDAVVERPADDVAMTGVVLVAQVDDSRAANEAGVTGHVSAAERRDAVDLAALHNFTSYQKGSPERSEPLRRVPRASRVSFSGGAGQDDPPPFLG